MDMFLEAGGQQHARQQLWILRLLSVSLRNPGDASIFRSIPLRASLHLSFGHTGRPRCQRGTSSLTQKRSDLVHCQVGQHCPKNFGQLAGWYTIKQYI